MEPDDAIIIIDCYCLNQSKNKTIENLIFFIYYYGYRGVGKKRGGVYKGKVAWKLVQLPRA
jgi:hypothetical protein